MWGDLWHSKAITIVISKITIMNIMKKLEISQELPKCDTETSEEILQEKLVPIDLNTRQPETFSLLKNTHTHTHL